jgi:hypothetical protein
MKIDAIEKMQSHRLPHFILFGETVCAARKPCGKKWRDLV